MKITSLYCKLWINCIETLNRHGFSERSSHSASGSDVVCKWRHGSLRLMTLVEQGHSLLQCLVTPLALQRDLITVLCVYVYLFQNLSPMTTTNNTPHLDVTLYQSNPTMYVQPRPLVTFPFLSQPHLPTSSSFIWGSPTLLCSQSLPLD